MGISISGSNSISGLSGNDTDFDKVLEQLKQIESTNLNRLEAWKSDWNLRYESFTKIIEQIQIASNLLTKLSDKNNFVSKLVQSSNDNIITAVANAAAQDVQHTINVSQVASNAIWANTGHIFDSRTDVINDTGEDQYFKYSYAGKEYEFKVPPNTTLESFASMINNSTDNPGIKVSIIRAGQGYVFQVAGKDTGEKNDLIIHNSNLVGMRTTSSTTSTWVTNSPVDFAQTVTSPTSFTYDIETVGGVKKSITLKGDESAEELAKKLTNAFGTGVVTAEVDPVSGELTLTGVKSFTRRESSEAAGSPAGVRLELPGASQNRADMSKKLHETALGVDPDKILEFTLTNGDDERVVSISSNATYEELVNALGSMAATFDGAGATLNFKSNGSWGMDFTGVTGISAVVKDDANDPGTAFAISTSDIEATSAKSLASFTSMGGTVDSSKLTLTFDKDKLSERIDGKKDGDPVETLTFTVVKKDGTAQNISVSSGATYQELLEALSATDFGEGVSVSVEDGDKIVLDGVKSFTQTGGLSSVGGISSKLETTLKIPASGGDGANDLFYKDPVSGAFTLEKAPDLEYSITTNDGKTGTLTLPSGSSFSAVAAALRDPTAWTWTDANGDPAAAPANFVKFTDASGKEYVDADGNPLAPEDIDGPIYISFTNVERASGPALSGQLAASSNWSIQRSADAKFTVDNWPIEMTSDSNSISDAIDGVVFSIQDTGTARITVSTDITSVEQSIQNFLDAVNSVILTVNELMAYDENKQVTSNDPNDKGNDNYSASGLTNQKGSLLTGNYGVQLFKTRFNSVLTTTPPGFKSQTSATDMLSGDLLASLANLGIKTDTDATSDTYGLLVLAPSSSIAALQTMDKENYTNMITNHLEAVVDFFCASGLGSSTSTDFRYDSHVEGITKGGVYDVSYEVTEAGEIINVMIGGVEAKRDESMPGYYFTVDKGDAKGLAINIDNLSVGKHPPEGGEPMQVRVKEGLVQTVNSFLKAELVFNDVNIPMGATESQIADAIYLKSQNGALMSLRDNYMTVMEGIDAKIEREQRRLDTWYNRQKAIFANLETLLSKYGEQQKSLEAQLKQLGGSD